MNVLDLFSGVGGFSLGLERAGMHTVAFCECDPFCREWLAQEWPGVPCYPDVRCLDGRAIGSVDVICGGFPCQDISAAGSGAGLDGGRSGLWFHMLRLVREVRPAWVVVENVPALRTRGADRVLADMASSGYACWPFVVGADDIGAPQRRKRVWIIARRMGDAERFIGRGWPSIALGGSQERATAHGASAAGMADANGAELWQLEQRLPARWARGVRYQGQAVARTHGELADTEGGGLRADGGAPWRTGHAHLGDAAMADGDGERCEGERIAHDGAIERARRDLTHGCGRAWDEHQGHGDAARMDHADGEGLEGFGESGDVRSDAASLESVAAAGVRWPAGPGEPQHEWEAARTLSHAQCRLGVSTDGLPARMGATLNKARLKAAGNAVVPEIPEIIGRVIMRAIA